MFKSYALIASVAAAFAASISASPVTLIATDIYNAADYSTYYATPDLYQQGHTNNGLDFFNDQHVSTLDPGTHTLTNQINQSLSQITYTASDDANTFSFGVNITARHDASMWSA